MTLKVLMLGAALGMAALAASSARATTTITDTQEGWLTATDSSIKHGIFNPIVGFCGADDCSGARVAEYRDFFTFSIPVLSGPIGSADLVVNTGLILLEQSPSITVQFTSTSAQTFAAFGNGTVFATETFTEADANQIFDIHLDAAAIAAINAAGGTTFEISGRITSPFSSASPSTDQLTLAGVTPATLVLTAAAVPEPATWALMLAGFSTLGVALRQRRPLTLLRA